MKRKSLLFTALLAFFAEFLNAQVNQVSNQIVCSGSAVSAVTFSGGASGTTYSWTNNNTSIGLAASGTGNIGSFTAVNSGSTPVTATITVTPHSPGVSYAYIPNSGDHTVSVINTSTKTVTATITVPNGGYPIKGVAVTPDGSKVYVTSTQTPGKVYVIGTATNTITKTITVTQAPYGIAITPDGSKVYVISDNTDTVNIISTLNDSLIYNIQTEASNIFAYRGIAASSDGTKMWLSGYDGSDAILQSINVSNNVVNPYFFTNSTEGGSRGLAINGSTAYIAFDIDDLGINSSTLSVANTSLQGANQYYAGPYAFGVVLSDTGRYLYVSNYTSSGTVTYVNTADNLGAGTIPVGDNPAGVSTTPDHSQVYVANSGSNTVSVISVSTNTVTNTISVGQTPIAFGNFIGPAISVTGTPMTFTITVNPIPTAGITGTTTACGSVSLTASGGGTYSWSGGNTPNTASNTFTSSATYTVTVTNSSNCTATASKAVTVNAIPTAGITGTGVGCGSVSLTATGGGTYAWSGGNTPSTAANTFTNSNTYTVTVTGSNSCSSTASKVVTVNTIPTAGITGTATACDTVSLTATGGSTYTWSGGTSPNTAANKFTNSGTYRVTVSGSNSCSATASQTVTVNTATAGITGASTGCGLVSLTATGGSSYAWSGGNSPSTAANTFTSSATYTVTVTTSNSCSATASKVVTVNSIPTATITAGGVTTFCQGGSVNLTSSAGSSYLWSNNATSASINATTTGNYTVTVTNANNCSAASTPTTVTVNPLPNAAINGPSNTCIGLQDTLTATGGTGYAWANGLGTNAQIVVQPVNTTTYSVTVTDANSCSATASQTVSVATPSASISGPTQVCLGDTVSLTANGGNTYQWANGLGSAATIKVSPTNNTTYTVTSIIGVNCSATASQSVMVNALPTATITPQSSTTFCQGGSVVLSASAGSSFAWSNNANIQSITVTQGGSYTVTVTNANNCSAASTATVVTVNSLPTATITPGGATTFCQGGNVTLTSSPGTSYLWSNNATTSSINVNQTGNYTVTVTNVNNCSASSTATQVTVNALPTATITPQGSTTFCQGGSVVLTSSAGISYLWNNNATTASITATQNGNYTVTVTNANNCSASSTATNVTVNQLPAATITAGGALAFCQGGSVTLTASAGTSYLWSNNATTASINATQAGSYTVTVTNSNNCSAASTPTTVTVNPLPLATITPGGATTFCAGGGVNLTAGSAVAYLWSDNETTQSINVTQTGSYVVTVTNINNCSASSTATVVTVNPLPSASISPTTVTFCDGGNATLIASGGISYSWSNTANTSTTLVNPTQTTTYVVTVTDNNSCSATASRVVTVNALPNAAINGPTDVCTGLQATLTASGGSGYNWNNGLGSNAQVTVQPTSTTTYVVTVTDINNCSATASQTVTVTNAPTASITGATEDCSGSDITLTANGGNTYAWANSLGSNAAITVAPTSTTTYTVTATIGVNCSATASQTVTVYQLGATQFSHTTCEGQTYNFNNQNLNTSGAYYDTLQTVHGCDSIVTLNLTVESLPHATITRNGDTLQTEDFATYQWLLNGADIGSGTTQSITITQNGSYSVVVTNANGCTDTSSVLSVTTLGVQDVTSSYDVKLYPNPNTGSFMLEFTDDVVRDVEITDAVGRTVIASTKVSRQQNFNVETLSAGVYIMRINQQGQVQSLKFTLMR